MKTFTTLILLALTLATTAQEPFIGSVRKFWQTRAGGTSLEVRLYNDSTAIVPSKPLHIWGFTAGGSSATDSTGVWKIVNGKITPLFDMQAGKWFSRRTMLPTSVLDSQKFNGVLFPTRLRANNIRLYDFTTLGESLKSQYIKDDAHIEVVNYLKPYAYKSMSFTQHGMDVQAMKTAGIFYTWNIWYGNSPQITYSNLIAKRRVDVRNSTTGVLQYGSAAVLEVKDSIVMTNFYQNWRDLFKSFFVRTQDTGLFTVMRNGTLLARAGLADNMSIGGTLYNGLTATSNVTTTGDFIVNYSIKPKLLTRTGDCIEINGSGYTATNTNSKTLSIVINSNVYILSATGAMNSIQFEWFAKIIKTTSGVKVFAKIITARFTSENWIYCGDIAFNSNVENLVSFRGLGAAADDIVNLFYTVKYYPTAIDNYLNNWSL